MRVILFLILFCFDVSASSPPYPRGTWRVCFNVCTPELKECETLKVIGEPEVYWEPAKPKQGKIKIQIWETA